MAGVIVSAIAAYFYVRVIVLMFFNEPTSEDTSQTTIVAGRS